MMWWLVSHIKVLVVFQTILVGADPDGDRFDFNFMLENSGVIY